jgi:WhiB family redox-sensing transcriptional regulator
MFADQAWQEHATCLGADPKIFFPDENKINYTTARTYCARCPVTTDCLNYALKLEHDEIYRYGMFGGKTPKQREWLRRIKGPATPEG